MRRIMLAALLVLAPTEHERTVQVPVQLDRPATAYARAQRIALCGSCYAAHLTAPAIGLDVDATPGGQEVIDAGQVAIVTFPNFGPIIYFAGHRTTHGAIFARVPELRPGDRITVTQLGTPTTYTVAASIEAPVAGVYQALAQYRDQRKIALQTSHPNGSGWRYLVIALA